MEAQKVIGVIFDYLEEHLVPGMTGFQEVAFYAAKEAIDDEAERLLESIRNKPLARAVIAVDKNGDVDVEKLAARVRKGMERKGVLDVEIPLYGTVKFVPEDIDNILAKMKGDIRNENHQDYGRTY